MTARIPTLVNSLLLAALLAAPVSAQDKDKEAALKKDLTSVIALHGQPCGEVTAVKVQAESDYIATCKDGNKYHVYEAKGRVVVDKVAK
jgi:hypothetical protein